MEPPSVDDAIHKPLAVVQAVINRRANAAGGSSASIPRVFAVSEDWGLPELFASALRIDNPSTSLLPLVPSLNDQSVENLPPESLTRFRCMVQETLNPEVFVGVYQETHRETGHTRLRTGKYCDEPRESADWEVVSFEKDVNYQRVLLACVPIPGESAWVKEHAQRTGTSQEEDRSKRPRRNLEVGELDRVIVKVYDKMQEIFKIGDLVEFVGVLSAAYVSDDPIAWDGDAPDEAKVVTLHCLTYQRLVPPLYPFSLDSFPKNRGLRRDIIRYLSIACGGDDIAAELLLMHMMSKVHARDFGTLIGTVSINAVLPDTHQHLERLIVQAYQLLLPRAKRLEFTVRSLCEQQYYPQMNYDTNKLTAGLLQSAPETFLIFDATKLGAGTLTEKGVLNLRHIDEVVQQQVLKYDFVYNTMSFQVDYPVIFISTNARSLLKANHVLAVYPTSSPSQLPIVGESVLMNWRAYIQHARNTRFDISDSARTLVSEFFVQKRKADPSFNETKLHQLLAICRLFCMTHLEDNLSPARWEDSQIILRTLQDKFPSPVMNEVVKFLQFPRSLINIIHGYVVEKPE